MYSICTKSRDKDDHTNNNKKGESEEEKNVLAAVNVSSDSDSDRLPSEMQQQIAENENPVTTNGGSAGEGNVRSDSLLLMTGACSTGILNAGPEEMDEQSKINSEFLSSTQRGAKVMKSKREGDKKDDVVGPEEHEVEELVLTQESYVRQNAKEVTRKSKKSRPLLSAGERDGTPGPEEHEVEELVLTQEMYVHQNAKEVRSTTKNKYGTALELAGSSEVPLLSFTGPEEHPEEDFSPIQMSYISSNAKDVNPTTKNQYGTAFDLAGSSAVPSFAGPEEHEEEDFVLSQASSVGPNAKEVRPTTKNRYATSLELAGSSEVPSSPFASQSEYTSLPFTAPTTSLTSQAAPGAIAIDGFGGIASNSFTDEANGNYNAVAVDEEQSSLPATQDDDEPAVLRAYLVDPNGESSSVYLATPLKKRRARQIGAGIFLVALILTVVLSVVLTRSSSNNNEPPGPFPTSVPSVPPSGLPTSAPTVEIVWKPLGASIEGEWDGDNAGQAVAISGDGSVLAIGAPSNDGDGPYGIGDVTNTGSVRVFGYVEATDEWLQLGSELNGIAPDDYFGFSVALSVDGNILAVGAERGDGEQGEDTGRVQVYQYSSDRNSWTQLGQNIEGDSVGDRLGWRGLSLSRNGTIVAAGAFQNDKGGVATDAGCVKVYEYAPLSDTWIQLGENIEGENEGDSTGSSVSLSSSGLRVAVGAYENDGNGFDSGSVRILEYSRTQDAWEQLGQAIYGEDGGDNSGFSVSLSSEGTVIAIGATRNDPISGLFFAGQVRIYEFSNASNVWSQMGEDIDGQNIDDLLGYSVSLSDDGSVVAIGATFSDINGENSGASYVYEYEKKTQAWILLGQIISGESGGDRSGHAVSLSYNGEVLAIGAPSHRHGPFGDIESGQVRVFQIQGKTTPTPSQAPTIAGSLVPMSPSPSFSQTSSLSPTNLLSSITIAIQLDSHPRETGWSLESLNGTVVYSFMSTGSYQGQENQLVNQTVLVPTGDVYRFAINDTRQDGIDGGYYAIYFGEEVMFDPKFLIAFQAEFISNRDETIFTAALPKRENPSISLRPPDPQEFIPISTIPESVRLNTVSNCDDCMQFVALPFQFNWLGDDAIAIVSVAADGQITVDSVKSYCRCYNAEPVVAGSDFYARPRIAVAQANLHPEVSGDIWTLFTGDSFIISWEDVRFNNFAQGSGLVNAQATLYPNGNVDICFGDGEIPERVGFDNKNIAAGLQDNNRLPQVAYPIKGAPFGDEGITIGDEWPTNKCQIYRFDVITPSPSMSPSLSTAPTAPVVPITVVIQLDFNANDVGWALESQDGAVTFASVPAGAYEDFQNHLVRQTIEVPGGGIYRFLINFRFGGFEDPGYYALYFGEETASPIFYKDAPIEDNRDEIFFTAAAPPTFAPTLSRSPTSSSKPTSSPVPTNIHTLTAQPSRELPKGFIPIANTTNATYLEGIKTSFLAQPVTLPFTFQWLSDTPTTSVRVSGKGQINIDGTPDANCCLPDAVIIGGDYQRPRIAVAQGELITMEAGGVWTLFTGESFIISWENVPFFGGWGDDGNRILVGLVNAQAVLFSNGDVDICWGEGDTASGYNLISAGLEDDTRLPPVAFPATGYPFGDFGLTVDALWPANQCRSFRF